MISGPNLTFQSLADSPADFARRSKSLEVLIPILYLKGICTGDFAEALVALLGKDAGGLSAAAIARLKRGLVGGARALEQVRSLNQGLTLERIGQAITRKNTCRGRRPRPGSSGHSRLGNLFLVGLPVHSN